MNIQDEQKNAKWKQKVWEWSVQNDKIYIKKKTRKSSNMCTYKQNIN